MNLQPDIGIGLSIDPGKTDWEGDIGESGNGVPCVCLNYGSTNPSAPDNLCVDVYEAEVELRRAVDGDCGA